MFENEEPRELESAEIDDESIVEVETPISEPRRAKKEKIVKTKYPAGTYILDGKAYRRGDTEEVDSATADDRLSLRHQGRPVFVRAAS